MLSGTLINFFNCLIINFKCIIMRVTLQTNNWKRLRDWTKKGIDNESNFWKCLKMNFKHIVLKTLNVLCCQYCNITLFNHLKHCNHWQTVQKGKRDIFGSLHTHLANLLFRSNVKQCNRNTDLRWSLTLRRQLIRVSQFECVKYFFSLDSFRKDNIEKMEFSAAEEKKCALIWFSH